MILEYWVARDADGCISMYRYEPEYDEADGCFQYLDDQLMCHLQKSDFPECLPAHKCRLEMNLVIPGRPHKND